MQRLILCLLSAFVQNNITALMRASEKGYLEVVTLLLEKGAYIEAKDNVSLSIFVCIVFNKYLFLYATSDPMFTVCIYTE